MSYVSGRRKQKCWLFIPRGIKSVGYVGKSVVYVGKSVVYVGKCVGYAAITQTFQPMKSISDDVMWYKYIYTMLRLKFPQDMIYSLRSFSYGIKYLYHGNIGIIVR